jgi:hypothetical protein
MRTFELTDDEQGMVVEGLGLLCNKYAADLETALTHGGDFAQSTLTQLVNDCTALRARFGPGGVVSGG